MRDHLEELLEGIDALEEGGTVLAPGGGTGRVLVRPSETAAEILKGTANLKEQEGLSAGETEGLPEILRGKTDRRSAVWTQNGASAAAEESERGQAKTVTRGAQGLEERLSMAGSAAALAQRLREAGTRTAGPSAAPAVVTIREGGRGSAQLDLETLDRQFRLDARRYDGGLSCY